MKSAKSDIPLPRADSEGNFRQTSRVNPFAKIRAKSRFRSLPC